MTTRTIRCADLFCGAGGTSTGLAAACRELGLDLDLIAINHWQVAIETHSTNHPAAHHLCESVDNVDPRKVVKSGRLHLLLASPECTHHSIARGGRPVNDQSRASAWHIVRWAEAIYIDNIIIENVREFRDWGPIGANGHPLKSKRGETYHAFLNALRSLGYAVDDRILNAADYGDPTTRERLFIIARRGGKRVFWPEPTHTPKGGEELFGSMQPYRTAREVIDWQLENPSIFTRKRPLAPTTLARIAAGMKKFCGIDLQPFLVTLRNHVAPRSMEQPVPTLTTARNVALCEPFMLQQQSGGAPRSVSDPVPTVATKGAIALVQPFLVEANHSDKGNAPRRARGMDEPFPTITTNRSVGLVEPFLINIDHHGGNGQQIRGIDSPVPTVTTKARTAVVEPFITKYFGTGIAKSVEEPLDTVTTKDRFGLVVPELSGARLDIRFRMLQPNELARAQGFPSDYRFVGTKSDVVKQIGNAVPPGLARALIRVVIADYTSKRKAPVAVPIATTTYFTEAACAD